MIGMGLTGVVPAIFGRTFPGGMPEIVSIHGIKPTDYMSLMNAMVINYPFKGSGKVDLLSIDNDNDIDSYLEDKFGKEEPPEDETVINEIHKTTISTTKHLREVISDIVSGCSKGLSLNEMQICTHAYFTFNYCFLKKNRTCDECRFCKTSKIS